MKKGIFSALLAAGLTLVATVSLGAEPTQVEKVQATLNEWLAGRGPIEKVTGVAAYISFGDAGPAIESFAGKVGRGSVAGPVDQDTLYQMGSTSKSFTAAVILKLEVAGKLSIDDPLGKWLPDYPAWKDVTIRHLLDMTAPIPTYSETEWMSRIWADEPRRDLTFKELVDAACPSATNKLPPVEKGYFYSNTDYILAGMIAEKVGGKSYRDLVHELVIEPNGLNSTFYEAGTFPEPVIKRLSHGYFANQACADYQPGCKQPWSLPIVGRDMREASLSWAQAAGGAISSARDVDRWMRAVFRGKVVPPKQQHEWMQLVSTKTGEPIADVSANDPTGFSLGLAKGMLGPLGPRWFYQGETLGYRTLYVWLEDEDVMITVQTNSQPPEGTDKLSELVGALYDIVKKPEAN
ncbi:serine hydrolase domain-containing protein [Mesorhizobium sp. BAC0120]|uniref:serine hydrolase domain-containing protein n=1 Tax=Mesorhizobium sp. BAC0120 TaxID=3090670 RepID=UPI00298C4940|nr:serine hydrolase domain-containing protein [Mesorhizobium sp. BAC0120]MDW6022980.1 serine hydrolase domain-containing protein [Mesorhizobium sp. BAC0120]